MILYLDTSAFVKLVLDEEHPDTTRAWYRTASDVATSVVTYPEAASALCRTWREQSADEKALAAWLATLAACWERCLHVSVDAVAAARGAVTHGLRGMDAVQLAAACDIRDRLIARLPAVDLHFMAFDIRLLQAAEREGFATLGPPPG